MLAVISIAGFVIVSALVVFIISALTPRPENLGVNNGQLAAVPDSPNCVSTQAMDPQHQIAPIRFSGDSDKAMQQLTDLALAMPRTTLITQERNYVHVEFRSRIFRFVDDVEFLLPDNDSVIHFRSASRVGHSDLGVNRARMEEIRKRFESQR